MNVETAHTLRSILRVLWSRDIYGIITTESDPIRCVNRLMAVSDVWYNLTMPVEVFIDNVNQFGQLTLTDQMLNQYIKALEFEPLHRDLPHFSATDYDTYIAPLKVKWAAIRKMFNDAGLISEQEYAATQRSSVYKN